MPQAKGFFPPSSISFPTADIPCSARPNRQHCTIGNACTIEYNQWRAAYMPQLSIR